jgi:hypothetical protein
VLALPNTIYKNKGSTKMHILNGGLILLVIDDSITISCLDTKRGMIFAKCMLIVNMLAYNFFR